MARMFTSKFIKYFGFGTWFCFLIVIRMVQYFKNSVNFTLK